MNKAEGNKGGRPTKIDGEKSVRLSATIRPRYREILDIISKHRGGTTVSETLELAILTLAKAYKIDNQYVIDMVRDKSELIDRFYEAINYPALVVRLALKAPAKTQEFISDLLDGFRASDPKALFILEVLGTLKTKEAVSSIFNPTELSKAITLDFMEGKSVDETISTMEAIISYLFTDIDYSVGLLFSINAVQESIPTPKMTDNGTIGMDTSNIEELINGSTMLNGESLRDVLIKPDLSHTTISEIIDSIDIFTSRHPNSYINQDISKLADLINVPF